MLRKFVYLNKGLCDRISARYPKFAFDPHDDDSRTRLLDIINALVERGHIRKILEIGCIDRPLLQRTDECRYDGLDMAYDKKCDELYDTFHHQSIEKPIRDHYDLIISKALLEHVPDVGLAMQNIYNALDNDGYTVHFVPSKNHPYSLILRIVGHRWQGRMISWFRPWAQNITGYHAYFDHCSPGEMSVLLAGRKFRHVSVIPFYRANDYFRSFAPLFLMVTLFENLCKKFMLSTFCSGFIVVARK